MEKRFLGILFFLGIRLSGLFAIGAGGIEFKDDYREDLLDRPERYVLFGNTAFSVSGGILKASLEYRGTATLNILPAFGKEAVLEMDFRRGGQGGARFKILANTRYGVAQSVLAYDLNMDTGRIWEINTSANGVKWLRKLDLPLDGDRWRHFAVWRTGDAFSLHIDGKKIFDSVSPPIDETWGVAGMNDYGGFSLNIASDGDDLRYDPAAGRNRHYGPVAVDFDNLCVSGSSPKVKLLGLTKTFDLGGRPFRFSAIVEEGFETWAEWSVPVAIEYLRDVFTYVYRLSPDMENLGFVLSRGNYYYGGKKNNSRSGIVHQWVVLERKDKITTHELMHDWSGFYAPTWAKEGMTYIAPLILAEQVKGKAFSIDDLNETKLSWDADKQKRFALSELDTDDEFVYSKGATLCYLIYRLIGYQGWLDFQAEIDRRGRLLDSAGIFDALEKTSGRKTEGIERGWIVGGQGDFDPATVFRDSDGDGLRDLDELLFRTNPKAADTDGDGLADKAEIDLGFDPRHIDPGLDLLLIPGRQGNDWSAAGIQAFADPPGDGKEFDVTRVAARLDSVNRKVDIRLEFSGQPFAPEVLGDRQIYAQLYFGANAEETSHRVNLWAKAVGQRSWTAAFSYMSEKKSLGAGGVALFTGLNFMEASIPLDLLGNPGRLFLRRVDGGIAGVEDILTARNVELEPRPGLPSMPDRAWVPPPYFASR